MKAIILGCGALATTHRNYTSLLVKIGKRELLLDCSGSPINAMLRTGTDPLKLSAVLLTHSHTDHIYALPILIHEFMLRGRSNPLNIFLPEPDKGIVRSTLNGYFTVESLPFRVSLFPVKMEEEQLIMAEGGFEVLSTPVEHSIPTLAYKFVEGEKTLVYAPDTRPCQNLVKFATDVDVLFHDCTYLHDEEMAQKTHHSTVVEAMNIAHLAGARKLILIHLASEADEALSEALTQASIEVIIAHDFLTVEI